MPDLLSPRRVAIMLDVSLGTLRNWRTKRHNGPDYVHLSNGVVRYDERTVRLWLRSVTVPGEWKRRLKLAPLIGKPQIASSAKSPAGAEWARKYATPPSTQATPAAAANPPTPGDPSSSTGS